jgi:hypothetical protein
MARLKTLVAARSARRPYRASAAVARSRPARLNTEITLARRALRVLATTAPGATYVVTDIQVGSGGPRRLDVVYVEQRLLGLPVYGARRSVMFSGRRAWATGSEWTVRVPARLTPRVSPEAAVQRAAARLGTGRTTFDVRLLSAGPGPERTSAVLLERDARATLHLAVYGAASGRLVWVVRLTLSDGDAYEVVVDAVTGKVLRRRPFADHAVSCLRIDVGAGGDAATAPSLTLDPGWLSGADRRFDCVDGDDRPKLPQANPSGEFCAVKATSFNQVATHAVALANAGLDHLQAVGARWPRRARLRVVMQESASPDDVAFAVPSAERPLLRVGFIKSDPLRHAASDPSVLLHEMGHLVLCAAIGGGNVVAPFETSGPSAAVNEGLADYLGLTLWNAIRRTVMSPATDFLDFGGWLFGGSGRDYTSLLGPGAPLPPGGSTPHARGMALCTALLRTRAAAVASTPPPGAANAVDVLLWRALIEALAAMPHEGSLPDLCCAARSLELRVPATLRSTLVNELQRVGISTACPHLFPV